MNPTEATVCSALPQGPGPELCADDQAIMDAEEAAFADWVSGFGPDPRCEEFADSDPGKQRFDEPTPEDVLATFAADPVRLETRGVTSQVSDPTSASNSCRGHDRANLKPKNWQQEFWERQTIFKHTVAAKLREAGRTDLASTLDDCHSTYTVAQCSDCGRIRKFPNRCDNMWCPECQPRLSSERRKAVEWWVNRVSQPKHVVLTVRNIPDLTKGHLQEFKRWWSRLRRRVFSKRWRGGFYAIEVTNEGRGWHLHLHALIDAKWIDKRELSIKWGKVNGGAGYIVDVSDARQADYLKEVTKYAVKGSELAKWAGKDIVTFISAFNGVRTFGVFGNLYAARSKFAEYIATLKDAKPLCDCGSCNIHYWSEAEWVAHDFSLVVAHAPRPPSAHESQLEMLSAVASRQSALAALAR